VATTQLVWASTTGYQVGDLRAVELGAAAITLVDDGPAVTAAPGRTFTAGW
jgi:hypothetical protein